jgi:hypothetical protein
MHNVKYKHLVSGKLLGRENNSGYWYYSLASTNRFKNYSAEGGNWE